jgi:hypothetical protein
MAKQQIIFSVNGKQYPMPEKLTFGDAALLKKMGINLGELAEAVQEEDNSVLADPVVMGGMLLVAMRRAGERVNANSLNDMAINEVEIEVPDEEEEEPDPLEPTQETKETNSTSETTPADSGLPDSDTSLESILGNSQTTSPTNTSV